MTPAFRDDLLQNYSDEELFQLISGSQEVDPDSSICSALFLSDKLVAIAARTWTIQDTLKAMEVARHLGIRVPQVFRTVTAASIQESFIIMERVDGTTLEEAWPNLSWITTVKLALQLRRFVSVMRSQTSPTAGALVTGKCNSFFLQDHYRLPIRSTPADMWSFIEFWVGFISTPNVVQAMRSGARISSKKGVPPMPSTFVLTHHDLAPRNMLVDRHNQLWIVDWEYAGWYPRFFEYAGMQNFQGLKGWNWFAGLRWEVFSWIATGRSERERELLESIRDLFPRFRLFRKLEIKRHGAPSEFAVCPSESEEDES